MNDLILGSQDFKFLNYLHINKVATQQQIYRDIFRIDPSNFRKKIRRYVELGLISRLYGGRDVNYGRIVTLTKKGYREFVKVYSSLVAHKRFRSNSFEHDLMLVDIRNVLMNKKDVTSYHSENQIQTYRDFDAEESLQPYKQHFSDAVLTVEEASESPTFIALEYEASCKSREDYRKKLSDFYFYSAFDAVLYVCKDKHIEKQIKKIDDQIGNGKIRKIFFIQLEELLKAKEIVTFRNQSNQPISFT